MAPEKSSRDRASLDFVSVAAMASARARSSARRTGRDRLRRRGAPRPSAFRCGEYRRRVGRRRADWRHRPSQEMTQSLDPRDKAHEIVLGAAGGRRDEIVARALLAHVHLEPVDDEIDHFLGGGRRGLAMARDRARDHGPEHDTDLVFRIRRIMPIPARRSANGSFEPVGFSPIAKNPASVSSLSARATAIETGEVGQESSGPCGL